MFDMSLLWLEGTEYSIQEARARSLGLLNKRWSDPPELAAKRLHPRASSSDTSKPSPAVTRVDFNDDGHKASTKTIASSRRRFSAAEPTVTINTKEALADVLGMFNSDSPEKTKRLMAMKKVDSSFQTPSGSSSRQTPNTNENARIPAGLSLDVANCYGTKTYESIPTFCRRERGDT